MDRMTTTTPEPSSWPKVLRAIRANLQVTQPELGDLLGVSYATVNRWEAGSHAPQRAAVERIEELATSAGVDVDNPRPPVTILASRRSRSAEISRQLERVERKLDKILRAMDIDP